MARETGKVIKSLDLSLKNKEEKKRGVKTVLFQKKSAKIDLIGKNKEELVAIFGEPSLVRKDRVIYLIRFDKKNCIAYTFLDDSQKKPRVAYFELRDRDGNLVESKKTIQECIQKT